jgi:hypothetical protein
MTLPSQSNPPFAVAAAALAFISSYAASDLWRMYLNGLPVGVTQFLALSLVWVPVLLIARATYRGRSWSRWFVFGLTAFGLGYLPWSLPNASNSSMQILQLTQASLHVLASVLLLLSSARVWFASVNPKLANSTAVQRDAA